jgi:hypothetical protein
MAVKSGRMAGQAGPVTVSIVLLNIDYRIRGYDGQREEAITHIIPLYLSVDG